MITEEQIQDVVRRIVEGYRPDSIILFGSYACGTPTEDSDLDLLMVKKDADPTPTARALALRHLLRGGVMLPLDLFARTPEVLAVAAALQYTVEAQALQRGWTLYAA